MSGKIINVSKKLWIEVINLNKNMYIMMKLNKYTPNMQSYTFEMESWTMIFNLHENSIEFSISFHLKMSYKDSICNTCKKTKYNFTKI